MILIPYSYNGTALQSTDYTTGFPRSQSNLQIVTNPGYIKRAGTYPLYSGKDFQPHTLVLEIECGGSFMETFESLNQLFDTKDETPHQFICTDNGDTDSQYYVYATAKQVQGGHDGPMATVTLALDDPIWQSVTLNSSTWTTTDSTSTTDITISGNDYSYPIFEFTPLSQPSTDYLYNTYVQVLPQSANPWNNRFLDIVGTTDGTGLNTAALVAAGKMQADGDDLRVFRDGVEVDRWLNGMNTTDTHIIVACDMPAKAEMTLKTAMGDTDTVTEIVLNYTAANKTAINSRPNSGRLIIDSGLGSTDTEEFTYTAKTVTATKLAFTVNSRSARGTSAFAHAANANVRFLPYDFNIIYGNSSVSAPVTDDTRKPIVALTSRNNSFVYSNFYDQAGTRPNTFKPLARKVTNQSLSRSDVYTSTDDGGDTDPSSAMGMAAYTYSVLGVWKADTITLGWLGYFPDGVASVAGSGAQKQTNANRPATNALQSSANNVAFVSLFSIAAQSAGSYGTWTTWTKASTDAATIPSGSIYLRWLVSGSQSGSTDVSSKLEMSGLTVGLTNVPHVMIRTEANNYKLDCTIYNVTTGESMRVIHPMLISETLIVDTDPDFPNAKYKGQIVGAVSLSTIRPAWLKLQPGSNTLSYETNLSGASGLQIVIKWRTRVNFF